MKVAVVTYFPEDPGAPRGGVEAVSVNLVRALGVYEDLDIHVVTLDPTCETVTCSQWGRTTLHRLPGFKGSTLKIAIGPGRRLISQYLAGLAPHVVHAHDTYGLMVKGLPIPRVFTIHGFIYGDTLVSGEKWSWLRSMIWKWVETAGWSDQPHIISISPYVRERLSGIARGTIHDIDNPIAESFFHIDREEQKGVIFSAAVISPRKNTLTLVKAFARLVEKGMDVRLILAGAVVEPNYGQAVQELIRQDSLEGRVTLLGRIGSGQIQSELRRASVFALVSLEENSPMGIEEAMAAGIPVVTSNRCGMPYMVRHGESGYLVDPNSLEDIARRLELLLQNDALRRTMGEHSRAIALDRFHPDSVARRTREVYLEAVRGVSNCPLHSDCRRNS